MKRLDYVVAHGSHKSHPAEEEQRQGKLEGEQPQDKGSWGWLRSKASGAPKLRQSTNRGLLHPSLRRPLPCHPHIPLLFLVFSGASLPLVTVWAVPFAKINKGLIFAIWMQRTETAPMGTGTEVRDYTRTQSPGRAWDPWGTLKIARRRWTRN